MNVGILSYSSVCQRKFLPALLLNDRVREITIASSSFRFKRISKKIAYRMKISFKKIMIVYISSIHLKTLNFKNVFKKWLACSL